MRATLDTFAEATAKRDWRRICDDCWPAGCWIACAARGRRLRGRAVDRPASCSPYPALEIGAVIVRGDAATARVRTSRPTRTESTDTVELVRQGEDWRIAAHGG